MTREIGSRIREARQRLKLSQAEVAKQLKIARSAVSLIETGRRDVTALELYRLSRILGVSMEELLGVERQAEGEELMYRAERLEPAAGAALTEFRGWCREYRRLEEWAGEVRDGVRAVDYPLTTQRQAMALADEERRRLDLGATPGRGLLEALEGLGIKVWVRSLPDSISGASLRSEEFGSAIVVNADHSPGRQVFTLAHEYFHLLTQHAVPGSSGFGGQVCAVGLLGPGRSRGERLADVFAGHLLLPPDEFIGQLQQLRRPDGSISRFDLIGLARRFGVSVQAVFVGLARLRLVPWELAREAYSDSELQDEILRVGGEVVLEPRRLWRLAFKAYQGRRITRARLGELLGLGPDQVDEYLRAWGSRKAGELKIGVLSS